MTEFKGKRLYGAHLQSTYILTKQRKLGSRQRSFSQLHCALFHWVPQTHLQEKHVHSSAEQQHTRHFQSFTSQCLPR